MKPYYFMAAVWFLLSIASFAMGFSGIATRPQYSPIFFTGGNICLLAFHATILFGKRHHR